MRLHWFVIVGCVSMAFLGGCGGSSDSANVPFAPAVANNSFETPLVPSGNFVKPGSASSLWSGSGLWGMAHGSGQWGTAAHTGDQYGFVQSFHVESDTPGSISQTLSGFGGGSYRVTFWFARRGGSIPTESLPITVYVNDLQVLPETSPTDDFAWTQVTTSSFVPTDGKAKIEIRGTSQIGDRATLIDDVSVEVAP